ncbi:MAG: amino acid ABC transporter permease [Tissierellia bacterium]|nr:amino acid ABC transporter permease [Tissierellia bacterium]
MLSFQGWLSFLGTWGPMYLKGTGVTILISLIGVFFGFIVGFILAMLRRSKVTVIRKITGAYVELIRGTPLVVQVMIACYGLISLIPDQYGFLKNVLVLSVITICLNSAAYISEIFRGGLNSVDKGQGEAARSLGLTEKQTMREIIFPQAMRTILPAIGNEFVTLIKESAIVSFVGIQDLMFKARIVSGTTMRYMASYVVAAAIYFILVFFLSKILAVYERRMNIAHQS